MKASRRYLSFHAAALRRSAQEANAPIYGMGKLGTLASGPVHGPSHRPSHGPVVIPRDPRALSIDPWRDVHGSADDHRCEVRSTARAPDHLLPRWTRSDRDGVELRRP